MPVWFIVVLFLVGCSTPIKVDEPLKETEYKNYYVLKEQKPDENIQEKVVSTPKKIKNAIVSVFKKDEEQPETVAVDVPSTNTRIQISTKVKPNPALPVTITNTVENVVQEVIPITEEEAVIIKARNGFAMYLSYLQAVVILSLGIYIYVKLFRKKKNNKNDGKVLKL